MATRYSRTKDEYVALLQDARAKYGDHLELPAFRLNQNTRQVDALITVPLSTNLAHLLLRRLPRDYNNRGGIQRAYKPEKIAEIAKAAKQPTYSAPGSIVGTIYTKGPDRPLARVEWDDNRRGRLIIDLKEIGERLDTLVPDDEDSLDEKKFKIGDMIDAHHRLEGHYQAGRQDLEMSANLYLNLAPKEMAGVFTLINEKQDKPSPSHTIAMSQMAGMLTGLAKEAANTANALNDNEESILFQRIRTIDGRLPKGYHRQYINLKTFMELIEKDILSLLPDDLMYDNERIIEYYFRAWRQVFPEEWEDEKNYVLVKAMGFTIMTRLFKPINNICTDKYDRVPNQSDFASVIRAFKEMAINVRDQDESSEDEQESKQPLDWRGKVLSGLSSGQGINRLARQLDVYLQRRRKDIIAPSWS